MFKSVLYILYIDNMEWPNYVYRDFNIPQDELGEIEIVILPENKLHIQVNSLHQNYTMDYLIDCPAGQADVVVKYHECGIRSEAENIHAYSEGRLSEAWSPEEYDNLNLFTVITTILDKLTDDHRYYLGKNRNFSDFIYCYPEFVKDNPDLPYIKCNEIYGCALLEFTLENMKYVGLKNSDYVADEELITLYGEVNKDGLFTYDYPIISREMCKKYYDMTRGHNVRRIKLEPDSLEFIIDPNYSGDEVILRS